MFQRPISTVVLRLAPPVLALLIGLAAPSAAQIPETFTNLQVLPKDIARRDLLATMRGIAAGLGVGCDHCHVESAGKTDFPSDNLATKKAARQMLMMTRAINGDYVGKLAGDNSQRVKVTCQTCHRGQAIPPRPLDAILVEAAGKGGAQAAIAKYKELKQEEPDSGLYDFRSRSVLGAASRLRDEGKMDEAIALTREGQALFPESAQYLGFLGQLCLQKGDLECADKALTRALALEPENANVKRAMDQLKAKRTPK